MPDYQRILVVSTAATAAEVGRLRDRLGRSPLVLTAPTPEARAVVQALDVPPRPEHLLAPVRFPLADRGHQLDELVRHHALADRFRDVVVVADPSTVVLLLRVMAPDQLAAGGAVTTVGLPRADRPVSLGRVAILGILLGVATALADGLTPLLALPALVALAGTGLRVAGPWRTVGRELLLAAGVSVVVFFAVVASSARFPGAM